MALDSIDDCKGPYLIKRGTYKGDGPASRGEGEFYDSTERPAGTHIKIAETLCSVVYICRRTNNSAGRTASRC